MRGDKNQVHFQKQTKKLNHELAYMSIRLTHLEPFSSQHAQRKFKVLGNTVPRVSSGLHHILTGRGYIVASSDSGTRA